MSLTSTSPIIQDLKTQVQTITLSAVKTTVKK